MLSNQRHLFDMPESIHYLNCAVASPLLKPSAEAGLESVKRKPRPWKLDSAGFFSDTQGLSQALATRLKRA